MKKIAKAFKFLWKNNRAWLTVATSATVILLVVVLVVTQVVFIRNTLNTIWGGERRVLVSGDPSKYQYYKADAEDFMYFEPETGLLTKEDAFKDANLLNEEISEEGFVLLKNEGGALPIHTPETPAPNAAAAKPKVSIFGKNSVNLVYGGSGSGAQGAGTANATIYKALEDAGFSVNPALKAFYENRAVSGRGRGANPSIGANTISGHSIGETPLSMYTDSVKSSYDEYKDAAIIVFSRIGGEGFDLPRTMKTSFAANAAPISGAGSGDEHYLQLDRNERALLTDVCNRFDKVIVIINCAAPMELGFIEDNALIDAALLIGFPGGSGINALGRILNGEVNPSGRLVDTYARNFKENPTWQNFGNNLKPGGNRYTVGGEGADAYFIEYEESIYIGYRYYETRGFTDGDGWYNENVVYPFGYGLSYNQFDWKIKSYEPADYLLTADGTVTVTIEVTNRGTVAGRDVVQMYYSAPYYDGEIEKPHVVLGDFAKTKLLAPNQTDTVTLTLSVFDMASYDYDSANPNGHTGYELDAGDYTVYIGRNAHDAWVSGKHEIYLYAADDILYDKDSVSEYPVKNRFDDVSGHIKVYLSRNDWEFTMPKSPESEERETTVEFIDSLTWAVQDDSAKPWYSSAMPTQGKKLEAGETQVQLYELISWNQQTGEVSVDYEDLRWDKILDCITIEEMIYLIGTGNFNTSNINSIGKPKTTDPDGPAGFTNFMGDPTVYGTCFYASECVIGATWNKLLAHDMGVMVGIEGIIGNVKGDGRPYSGWYAPAVNIHRNPFSGRNWEYYSEDGLLSGKMGAQVVLGAKSKGVYTYVKHFALNDQEADRDSNGLITWANEQSIRELYLKPFEIIVKEGGAKAMMSSFNRIGTVWAGGSYELLTEILRNEWGFKGMVISDYNVANAYMPPDQMIRAGGDLNLTQGYFPSSSGANYNASHIASMRKATKNILYTVASSNAMNGMGEGVVWRYAMPVWEILLITAYIVIVAGLSVWGFFTIRKSIKKNTIAE